MKRWNGWGNVDTNYAVPPPALNYLIKHLDQLNPARNYTKGTLLSTVIESCFLRNLLYCPDRTRLG